GAASMWLCVAVTPMGPTGFQRHDRAGRFRSDRRLSFLRYVAAERRVEVNATWGPSFNLAPAHLGLYGNGSSEDPDFYLANNPYLDLAQGGALNGRTEAVDPVAGLCHGVFGWPMPLGAVGASFALDVRLPVGNFRTTEDLRDMAAVDADGTDHMGAAW